MPTGPPDQSPPVAADFGPSHDAITAELLDRTWQFLTHASPTLRAELGQFLTDHGQHSVAGLGAFLDYVRLSAAQPHLRDGQLARPPPPETAARHARRLRPGSGQPALGRPGRGAATAGTP